MAKILIVDGEIHERELIHEFLQSEGHLCHLAWDSVSALAALDHSEYDLMLLDLNLKDETGLDLLSHVQERPNSPAVVIITAIDDPVMAGQAFNLGAYDYRTKPVKQGELLICVESCLRRKRLLHKAKRQKTQLENLLSQRTKDLTESQERFSELVEAMSEGLSIVDKKGRHSYVNQAYCHMLGYTQEELYQRSIRKIADPEVLKIITHDIKQKPDIPNRNYELTMYRKNGEKVYTLVSPKPFFDEQHEYQGSFAIITNITERKKAEQASKKMASDLAQRVRELTCLNTVLEILNKRSRPKEELLNETLKAILPAFREPEQLEAKIILNGNQYATAEGEFEGSTIEAPLRIEDKENGKLEVTYPQKTGQHAAKKFSNEEKSLIKAVAQMLESALKAKQVRDQVVENEERLRAVVDTAREGIITVDKKGIIVSWNQGATQVFGYEPEQALGKQVAMLVPDNVLTYLIQIRDQALQDLEKQYVRHLRNITGIKKNKEEFPLELSLASWQTRDGTFYTGIVRDLTEAKQMERQLLQAQKLESIGQLAAGIAHEINTPIQFVGDNLRFLEESVNDLLSVLGATQKAYEKVCSDNSAPDWVKRQQSLLQETDLAYLTEEMPLAIRQSLEGTERVAEIVRAMKAFSHPGPKERSYVDINQAITNTVTIARNEWKYVAECKLNLDPNLPLVPVLPGEFNQVILNLVVNAAQAISEAQESNSVQQGTITLTTLGTPEFAQIRVKDNGVGIEPEFKDRVFDPFYTTKPVGKGTGQGLAIVYDVVVNKHGGKISLSTLPGKGAEFLLELPLEPQ
ncbi:hybrid sensor histidine kinase/response regulator [Dethiosulfatarculus sandiegensis]|uniref:histidine kinase n=1 Tax=Dethiosulfatarculus sandiegensis TaxID=1429043 RepID=A0A0D2JT31_9BACT|nr:PAS domain S-box protein [Dethiosulfatarculus sandiegensis]KIX12635.1 hypothetical protein X474_18695 [Dethiosulfatarculus sandiegensis]